MGSVRLSPTIVVGLGNAGCRMAGAVNERAIEENVAEYVEVLGIDTRPEDVANTLPKDANSLVLEGRHDFWDEECERLPYLETAHELPPAGGAARQRPVGRSFLDNPEGLERTWQFLEDNIERFVTELDESVSESPVTELNVWVVNSLAGGTGSGMFPLVAGLLEEVLAEFEAKRRIETTIHGVGSLLRLDRLADQVRKPAHPPSYYLSAYTALSDLQALLGEEPAAISLHPDASQYVQDGVDVGGVFDQYLLVGVREQRRDHLNSINRAVADAIYYFGGITAIEDFPDSPQAHPARLFSLDAGELTFPVESAQQYIEIDRDIASTRKELDQLEGERREIADDLRYLDAVLSLERDSLPSSESPISRTLVRRCENEATAIARKVSPGELDEHVADAVTAIEDDVELGDDREFESSKVVRYLLLSRLIQSVERERTRTREELSDLVASLVETYRNSLRERIGEDGISTLESNPAMAAGKMAEFLEGERTRLIEERDESLSILTDLFGDLRAQIEDVEQSLEALSTRRLAFDRYQTLSDTVHEAFDASRQSLSRLRMDVEKTRYELDDRIGQNEHDLEHLRVVRERVTEELSEHTRSRQRATVPVEQPDQLDADALQRAREEGLTALVEAGVVEQESVRRALEHVCLSRQEPIQDREAFQPPFSVLAPILAEENTEALLGDVETAAVEAGFDMVERRVDTSDALSIGVLGLYAGIDLEATSEFGTLDEYFVDPDRELSELFGSDVGTVPDPVAYPELH